MNIHGVQNTTPAAEIEPVNAINANVRPTESSGITDTAEISTIAKMAAKIADLPEVRTELVERVKAELAAGIYETPEKLDIAIERLIDDLMGR